MGGMTYNHTFKLSAIQEFCDNGFTCTGMCMDTINHQIFMGNIGIFTPDASDEMKSTIVVLTEDFSTLIREIKLYELYPNMKDIQGVAYTEKDTTLWFCSFSEDKVYHTNMYGECIDTYSISQPTGIAYDPSRNCVWVLTYSKLIQISVPGELQISYDVKVDGQDQICYDLNNDRLLMTAGLNYQGSNYVYEINLQDGAYDLLYSLQDSYAVEGIALVDGYLYIANDDLYHNAKIPQNLVNRYI